MPVVSEVSIVAPDPTDHVRIDPIHIVVGCDDNYAPHLAVLLLSLFGKSKLQGVRVHVLIPDGFEGEAKLREAVGENAPCLELHSLSETFVLSLKQRHDLTAATYYRLYIGDLLPQTVRRVIYLDSDMMVRGELVHLWNAPLEGAVVGAVRDPGFDAHDVIGLPSDAPYFNAGLLLIDLVRWRNEAIGQKALAFAASFPERLTYNDQCALNWILRGKWKELEPIWNLQAPSICYLDGSEVRYMQPVPSITFASRIVHFNAPCRPWLYLDEHPFKRDYLAYRARTPWRDMSFADRYPHNMIIKFLRRHARPMLPIYHALRKII